MADEPVAAPAVPDLSSFLPAGPGKPAKAPAAPAPHAELQVPQLKDEPQDMGVNALLGTLQGISNKVAQPLPQLGRVNYANPEAVDQFTSQKSFRADGFDPSDLEGNNQRFASRETWGTALSNTLDDFSYKFKGSFLGNFETYGQIGSALWNMDLSKLELGEDEKLTRFAQDNANEQVNRIFQTPEEDDHFFNKQFAKDILGNAGFALGTFAAMGLELAADAGLEAITFGGATPVVAADAAGLGAKLLSGARKLGEGFKLADKSSDEIRAGARLAAEFDEGLEAAKGFRQMNRAGSQAGERTVSSVWSQLNQTLGAGTESGAQKLYQNAGKLFGHLPIIGSLPKYASRAVAAAEAGEGGLKVAGIGLAAFRRSLVEFNMAASEASFEGVTTYGDTLDKLVQDYRGSHEGDAPSSEELLAMRTTAGKASSANYETNLGLLLVSNKLQFGNLFSKFTPANKLMRDLVEESEGEVLRVGGKLLGKEAGEQLGQAGTRLYQKGFLGSYGLYGKIASDFGRKEATWQMAKTFGKDALRFEIGEGLQENAQETSAAGWKDYYVHAYQGSPKTLMQSMGEGVKEQFTQQGIKTFLMGALTGSIIHGITAPAGKGLQALQNSSYGKNNPLASAKMRVAADVAELNTYFKDPGKFVFNPQQLLFNQQVQASSEMAESATQGKRYEWHNAKENSLLAIASAARRLNMSDALTQQLKQVGENFSEDHFQQAFGLSLKDTEHSSVASFTNQVARDLTSYVEEIENTRRKLGPLLDTSRLSKGSAQQVATNLYNASVEQAVETVALNKIKGNLAGIRLQQLTDSLSKIEGLGDVSHWILDSTTTHDSHVATMGTLAKDIALSKQELKDIEKSKADQQNAGITYDVELHARLEKQLARKQDLYRTMETWRGFFRQAPATETVENETPAQEEARLAKRPYEFVGHKGALNDAHVAETFAKLLNEKIRDQNPEATTAVSNQSTLDGFQHVVDYIRLGKDERNYKQAVDQLSNPEAFIKHQSRIIDGIWKAGIALNVQALSESLPILALKHVTDIDVTQGVPQFIIDDLEQRDEMQTFRRLVESDPITLKLQALHLNPYITQEQATYADTLVNLLPGMVEEHLKAAFNVQPVPEVVEPVAEPAAEANATPTTVDTASEAEAPTEEDLQHQRQLVRLNMLLGSRIAFMQTSQDPDAQKQISDDQQQIGENLQGITGLADQEKEDLTNQIFLEIEAQSQQFENAGNLGAYAAWLNSQIESIYQAQGQEDVVESSDPAPEDPAPGAAPQTEYVRYGPTPENGIVAEGKRSSTPGAALNLGITASGAFGINPHADVARIVGDGLSKLENYFDFAAPQLVGKIVRIETETQGQLTPTGTVATKGVLRLFNDKGESFVPGMPEAAAAKPVFSLTDLLASGQLTQGNTEALPELRMEVDDPSSADVVDENNKLVAQGIPVAQAGPLVDTQNDITTTLLLAQQKDLLGAAYTPELGERFYAQASVLSKAKGKESVAEFYQKGGKTALRNLARDLKKEVAEPTTVVPEVILPTLADPATTVALFTSQALTGIGSITPELFDTFRAELESIWQASAENPAEGRNFGEQDQSSTKSKPTEKEAMDELFAALACKL